MAEQHQFDLTVVGGGPGGYVAAIRAAQLGMKVGLVEREHLGGICLNWGCIPTKALLRTAEVYHLATHAKDYGLTIEGAITPDLDAIVKRSRKVSAKLSGGVKHLLKKNKVTVIDGHASLAAPGELKVELDGKAVASVKSAHIIFATGARARDLPHLKPDGKRIWTYKEAMVPDQMPEKLLVIGSGAIGIEFASFYQTLGVPTSVVEILPRILPVEDEEISAFAEKRFQKQGMDIRTATEVTELKATAKGITAKLKNKDGKEEAFEGSHAILAIGIVGNSEGLGLEEAGVKIDRGHVEVDGFGQTGVKGLYAIGDLTGPPWLAHKASHEGIICVEKIAGEKDVHPLNTGRIPGCTYSMPQVASVGMTEAAAKEAGRKVKIGRFPFQGNGKAIALGEPDGMIKTIFDDKTGELLGAHMIGAEVTELIQGYAVGMTLETTEAELMHTVFPHPTLSEMMHEAVLDAYGRAIHF